MGAFPRGADGRRRSDKHRAVANDRDNDHVVDMSRERFEELVSAALDDVPPELAALMDNCVVLVEDDPPGGERHLLGVYVGTPLTERGSGYTMALPDRIIVFRNPTLSMCASEEEVVAEVHITVVHEIAHHFGIDDDRLHELGYA
jgi:predicted Zn-dependent protease with MMP-like domain